MHVAKLIYLVSVFGLSVPTIYGQRYMLHRLPDLKNEFTVSLHGFSSQSVSFSNLGSIQDPQLGTYGDQEYHDGFVKPTYMTTDREELASETETQFFEYYDEDQRVTIDGTDYIRYNIYSMEESESIDTTSEGQRGWELGYSRFFGEKNNWAIFFGLGFSPVDATISEVYVGDILIDSDYYAGGSLMPTTDTYVQGDLDTGDIWSPFVQGDTRRILDLYPSFSSSDVLSDEGWAGSWSLDGGVTTLRSGLTYKLKLFNHLDFRVQAGLYLGYVDLRFLYTEAFTVPDTEGGISYDSNYISYYYRYDTNTITDYNEVSSGKWIVGPYVEAKLNYQINRQVSIFSAYEYQSGESVSIENNGRKATIDLGNSYQIKIGFGYGF